MNAHSKKYLSVPFLVPTIIFICLLIYLITGLQMGSLFLQGGVSNENFFPVILAVLGLLFSGKLVLDAFRYVNSDAPRKQIIKTNKPFILAIASALFIICFVYLGFTISAFLYVFAFQLFFDDKIRRVPFKLLTSALVTGAIYVLYVVVFRIHFG